MGNMLLQQAGAKLPRVPMFSLDNQTEVTNTGDDYSVEAVVTNGTLNLGFKSVSRNVSWAYADNFRFIIDSYQILFSVSETSKTLNHNVQQLHLK